MAVSNYATGVEEEGDEEGGSDWRVLREVLEGVMREARGLKK